MAGPNSISGCGRGPNLPVGGGGGTGGTFTFDTLATIEALTPAVGDMGFPTNSPYQLRCESIGVWTYYLPGTSWCSAAEKPPTTGWSLKNTSAGAVDALASGILAWTGVVESGGDGYAYRAVPAGGTPWTVTLGVAATGNVAPASVGLYEVGTGNAVRVLFLQQADELDVNYDSNLGVTFGASRIAWDSSGGATTMYFFRLGYTGTNVTVELWNWGKWETLYNAVVGTDFTTAPDQIAVFVGASADSFVRLGHYGEA